MAQRALLSSRSEPFEGWGQFVGELGAGLIEVAAGLLTLERIDVYRRLSGRGSGVEGGVRLRVFLESAIA